MMRRIVLGLGAVALLAVISASDAQAARYRRASNRAPRMSATRSVAKQCVYPRVRQINGKSLWDLGKQNGQWPSF